LAAQLKGISVVGPVYFFLLHIYSSPRRLIAAGPEMLSIRSPYRVIPLVSVLFLVPAFAMYLHPSILARNFWCWIWQPTPLTISLFFDTIGTISYFSSDNRSTALIKMKSDRYMYIIVFFASIGAATHLYVQIFSGFRPWQLWIPQSLDLKDMDIGMVIRTSIQWDQLCIMGAAYMWLLLQFLDLKAIGASKHSWTSLVFLGVWNFALLGPGAMFMTGWYLREKYLIEATEIAEKTKDKITSSASRS
jgi:hypothetical protein